MSSILHHLCFQQRIHFTNLYLAHNMTAKHNFAKLVTLVTNLVPQMFFLALATTTVAAWSTSFLIFSY